MRGPDALASEVHRRRGDRTLLVLLDFDGTLCGFEPDPAAVYLPESSRSLLTELTKRAAVGIVSGRRLADVRARSRVDGIAIAGLHGLEIDAWGESFVHPDLDKAAAATADVARELSGLAAPLRGVIVEAKGASVALHFRESDPEAQRAAIEAFSAVAQPYLESGRLRLMRGSHVLELLPSIEWNKGDAVRWIERRVCEQRGSCFVVYVGDDVTDQNAFAALANDGFPIAASERVTASARLGGPAEVDQFLRALLRAA